MSYEVHKEEFEKNMKSTESILRTQMQTVLKKGAVSYADTATRYVPPRINGKWSKSIPAKLYKRGVEYIPSRLKRDKTNAKELGEKLREGYRFVVQGRLHGKLKRWYAKTLRKAKTYTRIYNRGLYKFLFGANLKSVGEDTPSIFQRLAQKSPNLLKHKQLNIIEMKSEGEQEKIRVANNAWDNDHFARESIYQGERAAKRTMKKVWKELDNRRLQA